MSVIIAATILPGCGRGGAGTSDSSAPTGTSSPTSAGSLTRMPDSVRGYFQYNSGLEDRTRLVVRDVETWEQVWRTLTRHFPSHPPAPAIDFSESMALVAGSGTRSSGGFAVAIERVDVRDGTVHATVRSTSPGPSCGVTAALTSPADVVLVPRTGAPVAWEDRETVTEC